MKIGILKEISSQESRVAAVPETVAKLVKAGMEVWIEAGAGLGASITDQAYEQAGAKIVAHSHSLLPHINILLRVKNPVATELSLLKSGSVLIAPLSPLQNPDLIQQLNSQHLTAFALDRVPRIARAQSMDILSSMSNIAGYKSVLIAANHLGKLFPLMTTAAGTISPAKVIVIGAGVAGLQAIATARRLGAIVIAFDTRPAAGEQVKSLGAEFVSLQTTHEETQDTHGYAKAQSAEFYQHEQTILSQYIHETDVIITTALIPGKRAPLLITKTMVEAMKPGSVIVDLAIEQKGNCELSEPGQTVVKHGVTIVGILNLPSTVPIHASQLYAKNLLSFLNYVKPQLSTGELDMTDEIIKETLITHQGKIIHPLMQQITIDKIAS